MSLVKRLATLKYKLVLCHTKLNEVRRVHFFIGHTICWVIEIIVLYTCQIILAVSLNLQANVSENDPIHSLSLAVINQLVSKQCFGTITIIIIIIVMMMVR